MRWRPRRRQPRYDKDGVPIDALDWEEEDWRILWMGYRAIKARIAARHKERREAACREATNGGEDTTT
jgi:hypothetical protein